MITLLNFMNAAWSQSDKSKRGQIHVDFERAVTSCVMALRAGERGAHCQVIQNNVRHIKAPSALMPWSFILKRWSWMNDEPLIQTVS